MRVDPILFITLLAATCGWASACTSGGYMSDTSFTSWRTMDLNTLPFNQIAWVAAGQEIQLIPVTPDKGYSSLGKTYTSKYNFVCMTATKELIGGIIDDLLPGLVMDFKKWPGSCSDGWNTKGLAVSGQMQYGDTGINRYNGQGPAVEQVDLITYMLAQYATVAEVRSALETGQLNPVLNPALEKMTQLLFGTDYSTLHYHVWDNSGETMVIEYSGPNNLAWFNNTDVRALANNPLYEQQMAFYNSFMQSNAAYCEANNCTTIHDSLFLNAPGAFNSSYRFIRAAIWNQPGLNWEWPKDVGISPRYITAGMPDTNPQLMAVINIIGNVWLPKGIDDAGGQQGVGMAKSRDIVWWSVMRDHKNMVMYYRVANTPMWRAIDFKRVPWTRIAARGQILYSWMAPAKWFVDESNAAVYPKPFPPFYDPTVTSGH